MKVYVIYSLAIFLSSLSGVLAAAMVDVPLSYALVIPPLAGACIAAFNYNGSKK